MNQSKLKILRLLLKSGSLSLREIMASIGLSYSRTLALIRELLREGYCTKSGEKITLSADAKVSFLKAISDTYDIVELFRDSREAVLISLLNPSTFGEIQTRTGFSQSTIYNALRYLMEAGVVQKHDDRYELISDQNLRNFLTHLIEEKKSAEIEPYAILKYSNSFMLKKVPAGKPAKGVKTGFSRFCDFGIKVTSPYDYYHEPAKELSTEEIFVHALKFAENKNETTLCAIFYAKNQHRMDPAKIHSLSRKLDLLPLWRDLQDYIRGLPISSPELFLPWDEFVEKASLYGVKLSPPPPLEEIEGILRNLGKKLDSPLHVYIFGGANLLLRGLKTATKDIDLIVATKEDFQRLHEALLALGYNSVEHSRFSPADRRANPTEIYSGRGLPRFDVFTGVVCNAISLSEKMKKRAKSIALGNLVVHLLSLEDVFLFKSITAREGDLSDLAVIVRRGGALNWKEIITTYFEEEKRMRKHMCFVMLDSIELLQEMEKIKIPIRAQLLRHCVEVAILRAVLMGARTIRELRQQVDFPEHVIRNHVRKLLKEGKLMRKKDRKMLLLLTNKGRAMLFESSPARK